MHRQSYPPAAQLAERVEAIVRSIASGDNACGTLLGPDGRLNLDFLRACVKPTLDVYEFEADALRADKMALSRESEDRRQVLEFVYSNALGQLPAAVSERLCQILGYCPPR